MVFCEICKDWFHIGCMSLTNNEANKVKEFVCPDCCVKTGQPYRFRSKPPNRKGKSRGPLLTHLESLVAQAHPLVSCPEYEAADAHIRRAKLWIERVKL